MSLLEQGRDPVAEVKGSRVSPVELACLDLIVYEIQRLARSGRGGTMRMSRLALEALEKGRVRIFEAAFGPREVDLAMMIHGLAERGRVVVATSDKRLLRACSDNRIPTLRPRSKAGLIASWTQV